MTIPQKPIDDVLRDGFSISHSEVDADHRDGLTVEEEFTAMADGRLAVHVGTIMRDGRQSHFTVTGRCGDEEHPDGLLSEEHRDGFMKGPNLLEKTLLRRLGTNSRVVGSSAVLNTIQTTPPLIPHALPSTPTPPSTVHTQSTLLPRDDAARSIDTSHSTLPANSLSFSASSTKSEKLGDVEQADESVLIDESMDVCTRWRCRRCFSYILAGLQGRRLSLRRIKGGIRDHPPRVEKKGRPVIKNKSSRSCVQRWSCSVSSKDGAKESRREEEVVSKKNTKWRLRRKQTARKSWTSDRSTFRGQLRDRSLRTWSRRSGTGRKKLGRKSCKRLRGREQTFCRSTRRRSPRSCRVCRIGRRITSKTLLTVKKRCECSAKQMRKGRRVTRHVFRHCLRSRRIVEGKQIFWEKKSRPLQAGDERRNSCESQSNGCCFDPTMVEQFIATGAAQAL